MKIQSINSNTNFRGLFTDKSSQNNGNWLMEYEPYCWECKNTGKMAPKERIDIFAASLPDNEEIFLENVNRLNRGYTEHYNEISKDIFGTESYYKKSDNTMRSTITERPAMNRENSLGVLYDKLGRFLQMKRESRNSTEIDINKANAGVKKASEDYDIWSNEFDKGFFSRNQSREEIKSIMSARNCNMKKYSDTMYNKAMDYVKLTKSIDSVEALRKSVMAEKKQLEELRKSGKLVDISVGTGENSNAALKQALVDIQSATKKFLCLPNKLVSMQEILRAINPKYLSGGYSEEIIQSIYDIIKHGYVCR